jgi:WD40 repeat protein
MTGLLPQNHSAVWSAAFSPDGTRLVIAGHEGKVQSWDFAARRVVGEFPGEIAALARNGTVLATAQSSPFFWLEAGPVALWSYPEGKKLREIDRPAHALALSSDGHFLALGLHGGGVEIWEVATGRMRRALATGQAVWSLSFSPAGNQLAATDWENEALVWDLERTNPPGKLLGHTAHVWSATFSPDGVTVATTSSDQTIRFWDAATLKAGDVLLGHGNEVWCAAFSPDGKMLATGSKDQTARLWETKRPHKGKPPRHHNVARPAFSPDGTRMALTEGIGADPRWRLWNVGRGTPEGESRTGYAIGFTSDGTGVVEWGRTLGALTFRSLDDHSIKNINLDGIPPNQLDFEQKGFSPEREVFFGIDRAGVARFWDLASGRLLGLIHTPAPPVRGAALGPAGRRLAISLEREKIVRLYDARTGRETDLAGHHDFASGLSFSPDGELLASASVDGTIKLWDASTGREVETLPGHRTEATDVAFSPDGRTLASVGYEESVKFWHLATGRELLSVESPRAGSYLRFSPDGLRLAVTTDEDTLRILDAPLDEGDRPTLPLKH